MKPYIVALLFGAPPEGKLAINAIVAPSPEMAVAMTMQAAGELEIPLSTVSCQELSAEFLEHAWRAIQGKLPENGTADVVKLVGRPTCMSYIPKSFDTGICRNCGKDATAHLPQ